MAQKESLEWTSNVRLGATQRLFQSRQTVMFEPAASALLINNQHRSDDMKKWIATIAAGAALGLSAHPLPPAVANEAASATSQFDPLPRDLEIELALSALPQHLQEKATVYVLNPKMGFELARKGTNGFHTFVARTGDDAFRGSWPMTAYRDDILYPIAFDGAGVDAQMRVFFDAAALQAQGVPAPKLKAMFKERLARGEYKSPDRAGVSYMLSPILRTYADPDTSDRALTVNFPHVMYYAPNLTAEDIGSGAVGGMNPRLNLPGPHGYINQPLGLQERAELTRKYEPMLSRLCALKSNWCLPGR